MNPLIKADLARDIASNLPLLKIVSRLRTYRDRGIGRFEVQAALEELRREAADEETEDRILEVLDFVSGFCPEEYTVWTD